MMNTKEMKSNLMASNANKKRNPFPCLSFARQISPIFPLWIDRLERRLKQCALESTQTNRQRLRFALRPPLPFPSVHTVRHQQPLLLRPTNFLPFLRFFSARIMNRVLHVALLSSTVRTVMFPATTKSHALASFPPSSFCS